MTFGDPLRIMISSTVEDLQAERAAAEAAIRERRFRRYRSESMPSIARPPKAVCETMARSCDAMVLILGERYGWTIPDLGISVTEFEFETARAADPRKILVFEVQCRNRDARQAEFVRRVKDFSRGYNLNQPVATPEELRVAVDRALLVWIAQCVRTRDRFAIWSSVRTREMSTWDFSSVPFPVAGCVDLPILSRGAALAWYLGPAIVCLAAIVLVGRQLDPWWAAATRRSPHGSGAVWAIAIAALLCALLTFVVGRKQWRYYFDELGYGARKEGIFERSIRQASPLERTLDMVLCCLAGALTAAILLPVLWFGVLATYSLAVVARSWLTLRRARATGDASWLKDTLTAKHNELVVGSVLLGWTRSHFILAAVAGVCGVLLWLISERVGNGMMAVATAVCGLLAGSVYRLLSHWSYRVGARGLRP